MSFQENRTGARKKMVPSRYRVAHQADKSVRSKVSKNEQDFSISGSSSQSQGVTSTPTSKTEQIDFPNFNVSVVCNSKSSDIKERTMPKSEKNKNVTMLKSKSVKKSGSYNSKNEDDFYDEDIAEAEIDLLYTSYLQATYLYCEAKKTLKERTANSVKTLNMLFTLVMEQLTEMKTKKLRLHVYSGVMKFYHHCQKQEKILTPVFDVISGLKEKYEDFAKAFNTSTNILHVKSVEIPESENEVKEMIQVLDKMSKFLNAFFEVMSNTDDIISSFNHAKKLADAEEVLVEALQRGMDLIVEATELAYSEALLTLSC